MTILALPRILHRCSCPFEGQVNYMSCCLKCLDLGVWSCDRRSLRQMISRSGSEEDLQQRRAASPKPQHSPGPASPNGLTSPRQCRVWIGKSCLLKWKLLYTALSNPGHCPNFSYHFHPPFPGFNPANPAHKAGCLKLHRLDLRPRTSAAEVTICQLSRFVHADLSCRILS